jgi:beta-lactamase class A
MRITVTWSISLCVTLLPFLFFFLVLAPLSSSAQAPSDTDTLPLSVPDSLWQPLRDLLDSDLQRALSQRLRRNASWSRLLAEKKMAISIVDLTHPEAARLAHINGDLMMYAASLPKIAILLAAMHRMEKGLLVESPAIMKELNDMIRHSSNGAATRMIDRVGGLTQIEAILRDPAYAFYDPRYGGGLWVGKRYSKSVRRNPDPLKGLSHAATANQVSRFYYLVAEGRLINEQRSEQMLDILSNPGINHKFVNTLSIIAPDAQLFRKSGSWRNWHSDSVLVWGDEWRRYIVVCLVEDENGERIIRNVIPAVETILKPARMQARDQGVAGSSY